MNPSRFLFALRRWWPIFIGCVVIGLLAALLYLKVTPERYTARADVMLSVGGSDAVDLSSGSNFAQQQARNLSVIATRQRVVEPVIRRLNLSESADQLSQNVTATVLANTSIVTLEVNYPTAVGAATIANAMADSLVQTATVLLPTVSRGGADIALRTVYQGSSPQAPTSPDTTTMLTLGLAGGLLAGAALILLLEALTRHRSAPRATRPAPAAFAAPAAAAPDQVDAGAQQQGSAPRTRGAASGSGWTWS